MRIASLACVLLIAACEGATTTGDPRFATPERTVDTLLASYGLADVPQETIRARLAAHDRFELSDRAAFEECFADLRDDPASEGMAGWVLGALAAGKDELRTTITADVATVSPRVGVRIVMHADEDRSWRISIAESVPEHVRAGIAEASARHDQRLRAQGIAQR